MVAASGWAVRTRINYLGDVRAMFAWAVASKLVKSNPCDGIEIGRRELNVGEIVRLQLADVKALMEAARFDRDVMVYLVLGLYGGIRPAEIERMDYAAVNVVDGHAIVQAKNSKTRRRRVVDLAENARAWLRLFELPASGPICPRGWEDKWIAFRRRLGWAAGKDGRKRTKERTEAALVPVTRGEWPHDALRHTFASMHYAHFQDEAALQVQMGHESADMLHQHYRGLVTRSEAAQFWAFGPETKDLRAEGEREVELHRLLSMIGR